MQERLPAGMTRRRFLLSGGVAITLLLPELSAFAHAGESSRSSRNIPQRRWRGETWLPTSLAYVDQHLGGRHG